MLYRCNDVHMYVHFINPDTFKMSFFLFPEASFIGTFSPLVAVLLAVLGTLLLIGVVALALVQIRKRKPRKGIIFYFP